MGGRALVVVTLVATAAACGGSPDDEDSPTVAELIPSGCSTAVVLGLSLQIAEEIACMQPGALVSLAEGDGLVFADEAVLPFVSADGRSDLRAALANEGGEIVINSGFRTVVQQYLLYEWFDAGQCGIAAAAVPGSSNHESGRAIDIANYMEWSSVLPRYGWEQTVPGDPVHFDHLDSPDNRGLDVLAFQVLWNRNNPDDWIDEDGLYGPMTQARLEQSPADGFDTGADCQAVLQPASAATTADWPDHVPTCAH